MVLADKIKHVEDHHLLELIQQARGVTGRVPTLHADSAAVAGQSRFSKPLAAPPAAELNIALHSPGDHHADQEDYLWGVSVRTRVSKLILSGGRPFALRM